MDEYTKKVIHYMNNPQFQGVLETYTHKCSLKSSVCGDWNDIYLNIVDDIIEDISYENSGCSLNISSLEIVCNYLLGKHKDELENLTLNLVEKELNFPKDKTHCIQLIIDTISIRDD